MFSVTAVQRYELLCAVTVKAAVSSDSQVQTCVPLLKAAQYAHTDVTIFAEVQRAPCLYLQRTHSTPPLFPFGRPVL
jgi:hypothetical protein